MLYGVIGYDGGSGSLPEWLNRLKAPMHEPAEPLGLIDADDEGCAGACVQQSGETESTGLPALAGGATLWLTGLPCSGKSTLAVRIGAELRRRGHRVEVLDADVLRTNLCRGLGFSKQDRDENVARIGWVCETLNRQGVVAVAAVVSPYREARARLRRLLPRFIEIYVDAPLRVCMERDVKGMYAKARRGEIAHFTGIDDPYEEPLAPEIAVATAQMTVDASVQQILNALASPRFEEAARTRRAGEQDELCAEPVGAKP